jgi:ABC-type branched-subunit amino acid transport system ATPase component
LSEHQPVTLLETVGLSRAFGGLKAVDNLDFQIQKDEIVSLIGPNGAGKSTVFNLISGVYPPTAGRILFKGKNLAGLKPHAIARQGISRTFQSLRLFSNMTVLENVLVGFHPRLRSSLFGDVVRPPWIAKDERNAKEEAKRLLGQLSPTLLARQEFMSSSLAYADRRLLELARAMASGPDLLMLDEPTAGMNPSEALAFMEQIKKIHGQGFTILLIEHNLSVVMGVSQRIVVMDYGVKIAEGTPAEIRGNERVIEAYLGRKAASA